VNGRQTGDGDRVTGGRRLWSALTSPRWRWTLFLEVGAVIVLAAWPTTTESRSPP
jgi:hypothetical protein